MQILDKVIMCNTIQSKSDFLNSPGYYGLICNLQSLNKNTKYIALSCQGKLNNKKIHNTRISREIALFIILHAYAIF